MTVNNNSPDEQVFTLRDLLFNYLALARRGVRYWFRGAVFFTLVFLVGMAFVMTRQRVYKSEASFQVVESTTGAENSDASQEAIQRSVEARLDQVYGSRRYMMNIIRQLHLYDQFLGVGPDGRPVTSETKVVSIFTSAIDRRVERNIVHLGFIYKDPLRAQQVVQSLIRLFVNERKMAAEEQARDTLTLVESQLHELEGVLAERQDALDRFMTANEAMVAQIRQERGIVAVIRGQSVGGVQTGGGLGAGPAQSADSRTSARSRRLRARVTQLTQAIEMLRNPGATPAASSEDPAEVVSLRERLREKRDAAAALRARNLLPDHPTRAAAERELADVESQLNAAIARHRGVVRERENLTTSERNSRIEELTRDLAAARTELTESERMDYQHGNAPAPPEAPRPQGALSTKIEVEAVLDRLTNDLTGTRTAYNELLRRKLERQSDLRRITLAGGETVRIIDPPSRPVDPEPPGRTKLAAIALFLAMMTGLGVALVSGFLDTRIYDLADLRRWGELPELPFIPELHLDAPIGNRERSAPPGGRSG